MKRIIYIANPLRVNVLEKYIKEFDYGILKKEEFFWGLCYLHMMYYLHDILTILEFLMKNFHSTKYFGYPDINSMEETLAMLNDLKTVFHKLSK